MVVSLVVFYIVASLITREGDYHSHSLSRFEQGGCCVGVGWIAVVFLGFPCVSILVSTGFKGNKKGRGVLVISKALVPSLFTAYPHRRAPLPLLTWGQ